MLRDHKLIAGREAERTRRHQQSVQELGAYIDDLDVWDWIATISFRHAVAPDRAFARAESWINEVDRAAGGGVTSAIAQSCGEIGGRVHLHLQLSGVSDLDMEAWTAKAKRAFGDCRIEEFNPSQGGSYYWARNALSENGDYRISGKAVEDRLAVRGADHLAPLTASSRPSKSEPSEAQCRASRTSNQTPQMSPVSRVAMYARGEDGTATEDFLLRERIQVRPLTQFLAARGYYRPRKFVDVPVNKASTARRNFDLMMEAAQRGELDLIAVVGLDRFGANIRTCVGIVSELRSLGVGLISLNERLDTTTARGRASMNVVAELAKVERRIRAERAEAALDNVKRHGTKSGRPIGRPKAKFDVAQISRWKDHGWGVRKIARKVGVSPTTVWRAINAHQQVSKSPRTHFGTGRGVDEGRG